MRCPDCNKFVELEAQEPEVEYCDIDEEGHITASVRFVRCCAECSNELKEFTFEMEGEGSPEILEKHQGEGHELLVDYTDSTCEEQGGGRYKANVFTCTLECLVTCSCQKDAGEPLETITLEASCKASEMEELV